MIFKNCEEITKIVDGRPVGSNEGPVISLSPIDKAKEGSLSFISDEKYIKFLSESKPTCLIVKEGLDIQPDTGQLFIFTDDPYREFLKILKYVAGRREFTPGIHPKAVVEDSAIIAESAYIGPGCVIGKNARIGEKTRIGANTVIYDNVIIGSGTDLHANVTCYQDSEIGNGCVIHSGAVIGADGFGFYEDKSAGAYEKIPQIGNVIIEDDVEIGANTTIDRAMMGSTIIGKGVKLDNLIHIAHNCKIGENTAMAAQAGVSGSVIVGRRCRFGGQVGLAGHIEVADDVIIMAQSGLSKGIDKKGIYFGSPAKEHRKAFRIEACIRQLPELFDQVNKLSRDKDKDQ